MVKSNIDKKFSAHYDAVEQELKSSTVGKWALLWFRNTSVVSFFFSVRQLVVDQKGLEILVMTIDVIWLS